MSKTIRNYSLVQKLGTGSYAIVYRGVHTKTNANYAVKVIAKEKLGSIKLQENLDSEISIMRDYVHRNVVQLYDHFSSNRHIYLVLEFCGGGDLQRYIRKRTRLSETETRRFLVQLAQGLKFLHSRNIIHRDIKPQNLLLTDNTPNAIIKFADFGFAKHLVEAAMAQTPCGTPLYMAPEIFEMQEYDVKADLWSIGCVLYEMLVGMPPFRGANPRELFMNIRSKQLRIPSNVVVSADMLLLLQKLLEINPRHRIGMQEFCAVAGCLFSSMAPLTSDPDNTAGDKHTEPTSGGDVDVGQKQKELDWSKSPHRDATTAKSTDHRERSRDRISDSAYSSTPPTLSTSARGPTGAGSSSPTHTGAGGGVGTQRVSGVSPSTATMILALTSSSIGGAQAASVGGGLSNTGSGGGSGSHCRGGTEGGAKDKLYPSPEERFPPPDRHRSIGEASAVSRALSPTAHGRGSEASGTPVKNSQQSPFRSELKEESSELGRNVPTGITPGVVESARAEREDRTSPSGEHNHSATAGGGVEVENSDDFVFIEQATVHIWRALDTDYSHLRSSNRHIGLSKKNFPSADGPRPSRPPQWHGNAGGPTHTDNVGNVGDSQDSDYLHFSGIAHAVSFVVTIVAAMTCVADGRVKYALHRRHKLQSRHTGQESVGSGCNGGDSLSRQRTGSDFATLSDRLCDAFVVYLHAVGLLQDIIQRTMTVSKNIHRDSAIQGQIDTLLESLAKRYDQLLRRADSCKEWLQEDDPVPAAEPILYKEALALAQEGLIEELLGNLSRACSKYASAKLLVECVLLTATEPSDKRVLQGLAQLYADQFTQCEKSKNALLDYGDTSPLNPAEKRDMCRNRTMSRIQLTIR